MDPGVAPAVAVATVRHDPHRWLSRAGAARFGLMVDESVPHSARVWNYWLGGTDNFPVDREVGEQVRRMLPSIVDQARADRAFLGRAVTHLVADRGVRQFLDIGSGLPAAENTHEVAQRLAPDTRVVYVDNDPLVLVHAQALLTGETRYLEADLHDPDTILDAARETLDLTAPVALMLIGVLHHVEDTSRAREIVRRLLAALPSGSYLAVNHASNAVHGAASDESVRHWNRFGKPSITLRSPEEIGRFFDGLDLLPPGVVSCAQWQPGTIDGSATPVDEFAGLAFKP